MYAILYYTNMKLVIVDLNFYSVIYDINKAVCIGIVSAKQYCQYACGRQPGRYKYIHTCKPLLLW